MRTPRYGFEVRRIRHYGSRLEDILYKVEEEIFFSSRDNMMNPRYNTTPIIYIVEQENLINKPDMYSDTKVNILSEKITTNKNKLLLT
jgi:hypothetical protein